MSSVVNNISEKIQDEYSSSREKIKSNYIDEKYNTISRYKNKTRDCDIDKSFNFEYGNLKDNQTLSRNMSPLNHSQKISKLINLNMYIQIGINIIVMITLIIYRNKTLIFTVQLIQELIIILKHHIFQTTNMKYLISMKC